MHACEDNVYQALFSGRGREPGYKARTHASLEVPDRPPQEMRDDLDQLLIKPSSEVGVVT